MKTPKRKELLDFLKELPKEWQDWLLSQLQVLLILHQKQHRDLKIQPYIWRISPMKIESDILEFSIPNYRMFGSMTQSIANSMLS